MSFDHAALLEAVKKAAVLKYETRLEPISAGGIVCPPTYAGSTKKDPSHISFREGWVNGELKQIVLLDSVQSQANRVELAILEAAQSGVIAYPDIRICFNTLPDEPDYSVLQLSHRIYDAVLRACTLDEVAFPDSSIGKAVFNSRSVTATALFEHAPITLILGGWDSHSGGGPLVAKLPRLMTSEIIGLDAKRAEISSTKLDPMDIRKSSGELVQPENPREPWYFKIKANMIKGEKAVDPSAKGFGSVPASNDPRAAVISSAIQSASLSFTGLRQINFPDDSGERSPERDQAGRAVLAALGIYGLSAQADAGYLLRSRCELVPIEPPTLSVIGRSLSDSYEIELASDDAQSLLETACKHASTLGLIWRKEPLILDAQERLATLVQNSRAVAAVEDSA